MKKSEKYFNNPKICIESFNDQQNDLTDNELANDERFTY